MIKEMESGFTMKSARRRNNPEVPAVTMRFALVIAVSMLASESAQAQGASGDSIIIIKNMSPLTEYINKPSDQQVKSYPFLRCTGLFLGFERYTGKSFNEETENIVNMSIESLALVGSMLALDNFAARRGKIANKLTSEERSSVIEDSRISVQSFAKFYEDRFQTNYLQYGAAVTEDPLISGDLNICGLLAKSAKDLR